MLRRPPAARWGFSPAAPRACALADGPLGSAVTHTRPRSVAARGGTGPPPPRLKLLGPETGAGGPGLLPHPPRGVREAAMAPLGFGGWVVTAEGGESLSEAMGVRPPLGCRLVGWLSHVERPVPSLSRAGRAPMLLPPGEEPPPEPRR